MAELSTLGRPYARAAFEYANGAGQLAPWADMLGLLSALTKQEAVAALLGSPSETPAGKAARLIEICGDSVTPAVVNFIHILAENRRLALLPVISEQFNALKAEQEKNVAVEVVSARALTADQQETLAAALKTRLQRDVTINVSVDSALLGGAVIRAGDTIIDGSVRGRLTKLAEALNS